jgi:heat shock protein HslJ
MKPVLFALILALLPHTTVAGEAASSELIGISWKLVKIVYSDNTIYKPDDPTKYTLTFQDEEQVAVRIDCNRGYGTWKSSAPGKLEFGPMTATQAMCPPGSLYGLVICDLPNFRSYVLKDGKLFLALMADGGILRIRALNAVTHSQGVIQDMSRPPASVPVVVLACSSSSSSLLLDRVWRNFRGRGTRRISR